jgi:hypothetical protein
MDELTPEILADLFCHDITPAVSYTKSGMHIKLTPDMERWFEQEQVTNEPELMAKQQDFDELFMPYDLTFCYNDDLCPWYSIGLTSAPCAAIGGIVGYEEHPPKYVFSYFCQYQLKDWVEELIRDGEVTFETFVDFTSEYEQWQQKMEEME